MQKKETLAKNGPHEGQLWRTFGRYFGRVLKRRRSAPYIFIIFIII
jgi:hypothetical protein